MNIYEVVKKKVREHKRTASSLKWIQEVLVGEMTAGRVVCNLILAELDREVAK